MDSLVIFWLIVFLIAILIVVGLIYSAYWIPQRLGYRKLGIGLSSVLTIGILGIVLSVVFEDDLFFKTDVREKLGEHHIALNDEFELKSNKMTGIGDFYHRFELSISQDDKEEIINRILTADTYRDSVPNEFNIREGKPRYSDVDTSFTVNYQNKWNYVYEYYQPNRQGIKPTRDRITIPKTENKLIYERILD